MKKIRFSALFVSLVLMLSLVTPAFAIEEMAVDARFAVLMDATYGDVLYDQNAYEKAYPASITKLTTALLVAEAVESGDLTLDQLIPCPPEALADMTADSSTQNIVPGESLSVIDLLHCLLLASANESANILAVAVSGDIPTFVEAMNHRVAQLGCEGTHYMNPHGLHHDDHYTTAYDVALILQEVVSHDLLRQIISTPTYTTAATEKKDPREFYNTNGLVSPWYYSGYTYKKAIGGKTGTTGEAGHCLATYAEDTAADETLISVVLGAENVPNPEGGYKRLYFTESSRLLEWGFTNFKRTTIAAGETPVAALPVTLSQETDEVLLRPSGSIDRTLPVDIDLSKIEKEISLTADSVEAPVTEGDVLGSYTLTYEGEVYGVFDLVALTSVKRSELLDTNQEFSELIAVRDHLVGGAITFSPIALIAMGVIAIALILIVALILARHHAAKSRRGNRRGIYSGRR